MLYRTKSILIDATLIAGKQVILSEKDFLRLCEPAEEVPQVIPGPPRKPRARKVPAESVPPPDGAANAS